MKRMFMVVPALVWLVSGCSGPLPSLPGIAADPGMALVKGGSVFTTPGAGQYSYVLGVDGKILPTWTGAQDVAPGKHRFAFGGSHPNDMKSYLETTLTVNEGVVYLVEASTWSEAVATYIVYELPGRKEIYRATAPLIASGDKDAGAKITESLMAKGWTPQ